MATDTKTEARPWESALHVADGWEVGEGTSFDSLVEARFEAVQAKWLAAEAEYVGMGFPGETEAQEEERLRSQAEAEDRRKRAAGEAEARYRRARAVFEFQHGAILYEYWTSSVPGGVVVTVETSPRVSGRLIRRGRRAHVFRFTDYLSRRYPEAGEYLFAGDALAAICEEVLRGPTQRIALTQVFTAASQLLSSLDSYEMSEPEAASADLDEWWPPGEPTEAHKERMKREAELNARRDEERRKLERMKAQRLDRAQAGYRRALGRADRFYRDGAAQAAQFYYFKGMLFGAAIAAVMTFAFTMLLPVLAGLWGLTVPDEETAAGFAAAAAGSLGACVSVMWRMTAGTFGKEAVFGADNLARLGAFRPFLGAMFGLILYVALQAGVISETYIPADPSWYFYMFLGFLAGFSERLVPDFLGESEKGLSPRAAHDGSHSDSVVELAASSDDAAQTPVITA